MAVVAGAGGGLGGSETAGADGVAAGAEIVAVTVDGVTRKAAAADAADERASLLLPTPTMQQQTKRVRMPPCHAPGLPGPQHGAERVSIPSLAR